MRISRWASSRALVTDTHSPSAIEPAPASSPASPVTRMPRLSIAAPATPITRLRFRAEPVVGAEHRRPQGVAADRAVPALEAAEEAALQAARLCRDELVQHARVPALVTRHRGPGGLGLPHV